MICIHKTLKRKLTRIIWANDGSFCKIGSLILYLIKANILLFECEAKPWKILFKGQKLITLYMTLKFKISLIFECWCIYPFNVETKNEYCLPAVGFSLWKIIEKSHECTFSQLL